MHSYLHSYPNASLTPLGFELLIHRHFDEFNSLNRAAEARISLRSLFKWQGQFLQSGEAALAVRRSVRRNYRRTLDPQQLQYVKLLRNQRSTLRRIGNGALKRWWIGSISPRLISIPRS